jgi:hypothetical protein
MEADVRAEFERIKERNRRVEADKAWETSLARKLVIALFTYIFAAIVLASIGAPSPLLNGLIPAFAFLFSTETFGFLKKWWIENHYKK